MAYPFAPKPKNGCGLFSPNLFFRSGAVFAAVFLIALAGGIQAEAQAQDLSLTPPSSTSTSSTMAPASAPSGPQGSPTYHDYAPRPSHVTPNPTPPPAEITAKIDPFFKGLMNNDVRTSFTNLLAGTKLAGRDDNVNALIDHTDQALALYGKMNDYEVYDTRFVGTRVVVVTYLAALQVQPIRWRFIFYKADKNWTLINLAADDSMEDILE